MSGPLQLLMDVLQGTKDQVLPSLQAFPPLDLEQVARKLRVDERAAENGASGLPATDATRPDLAEGDILGEIEQRARQATEEYQGQVDLRGGRIRRALVSTDQYVMIEAAGEEALSSLHGVANIGKDKLHTAFERLESRKREYREFRSRHGLTRPPQIVAPANRLFRLLVLFIILAGESVFNGLSFAQGSEQGIIGGVWQAMVLALFNVGLALLFAFYGYPRLVHRHPASKTVGVVALIAYITLALTLNLLIAHYRDLFILLDGNVPVAELGSRMREATFALKDMQSWMLFGLGCGFSLICAIDASGLEDPYPGYGRMGREYEEAKGLYADEKQHWLTTLSMTVEDSVAKMGQVIQKLRADAYDLELAAEGRTRDHRSFVSYLDHLAGAYEKLIQRYRESNQKARGANSPPPYFRTIPARPSLLEPLAPPVPIDLHDDMRAKGIARMEHFIKTMNEELKVQMKSYESIAAIAEGQEAHRVVA